MQLPLVDVIIPHLNDPHRLGDCLALLHCQSYPADRTRILVVDNGSDQPIADLVAQFPLASWILETEKGCGSARNKGVGETHGDIIAFTDSDCRPERDWITNAVTRLGAGDADIVAGDIKVFAADEANPTDAELFDKVFGFEARRYAERKHFATGANIIVPRAVFVQVGPFRNGLMPEDLDWGRRAHAKGFRIVFAPEVVIRHPARRTWSELKRKTMRTSWHARNYMAEQDWFRLRWAIYTAAMASPPLIKICQILTSPELKGAEQRIRTIRMLLRVRHFRVRSMAALLVEGRVP